MFDNHLNIANPRTLFLRRAIFCSLFLSFIMSLIHGITSHTLFPALGLIALGLSSLQSGYILSSDNGIALGPPTRLLTPFNVFVSDFFLALINVTFLVFSYMSLSSRHDFYMHEDLSRLILGTICTMFIMMNSLLHIYFALAFLLRPRSWRCSECSATRLADGEAQVPYRDGVRIMAENGAQSSPRLLPQAQNNMDALSQPISTGSAQSTYQAPSQAQSHAAALSQPISTNSPQSFHQPPPQTSSRAAVYNQPINPSS